MKKISLELESQFNISPENWLHRELATPLGFEKWTNRPNGIIMYLVKIQIIYYQVGHLRRFIMWRFNLSREGTAGGVSLH